LIELLFGAHLGKRCEKKLTIIVLAKINHGEEQVTHLTIFVCL
jgi:hypothetical protein